MYKKRGLSSRGVHKIVHKRPGIKIDGSPANPCLSVQICESVRRRLKYVAFYVQTVRKKVVAARCAHAQNGTLTARTTRPTRIKWLCTMRFGLYLSSYLLFFQPRLFLRLHSSWTTPCLQQPPSVVSDGSLRLTCTDSSNPIDDANRQCISYGQWRQ